GLVHGRCPGESLLHLRVRGGANSSCIFSGRPRRPRQASELVQLQQGIPEAAILECHHESHDVARDLLSLNHRPSPHVIPYAFLKTDEKRWVLLTAKGRQATQIIALTLQLVEHAVTGQHLLDADRTLDFVHVDPWFLRLRHNDKLTGY